MRVAENQSAPRANVVQVFATIDVKQARALGMVDDQRRAAHSAKSAYRAVDAADENLLGAFEQIGAGSIRIIRHNY